MKAIYFSRYGLERNYNSTTIFTLHLAFIDLCFCVICIPQYTLSYIAEQWPFGEFLCKWSGPIIFLITFVDWICLGFIALSRCLNMTKPKMWNNFCNKKTNVAVILIGMWALSALMTLPSFLEVLKWFILPSNDKSLLKTITSIQSIWKIKNQKLFHFSAWIFVRMELRNWDVYHSIYYRSNIYEGKQEYKGNPI